MNRRAFLKSAAGVAALSGVAPAMAERDSIIPKEPIRIGLLGAAHSHAPAKIKLLQSSPEFELAGVCEPDPKIQAELSRMNIPLLTRQDLFAEVEAIAVESAVQDHASDARAALLAGKHVHLEKPPAEDVAGLRELLDLAQRGQRVLQIGYMWRFNPGLSLAMEAARQGWLGDLFLVRATMNTFIGPEERTEWARFGGGALFEQGAHLVDLVVRLLGRPQKITSFLKSHGPLQDGLADNTLAILEYPRAMAVISNAALLPRAFPHRFFEIAGANGTALVKPIEPPRLLIDLGRPAGPYAAGSQEVTLAKYERYVDEFVELAAAIRTGRPLGVTPEVELMIQEVLIQACRMPSSLDQD
jgi:predicted dehydrogenase